MMHEDHEYDHGHKIFCMMNSGKPLTKMVADVLLFNAVDMYQEGRKVQRVKSRQYDGVIESNLEVTEYAGVPAIQFEALISTEKWDSNVVRFVVRVDDMEGIEQGEWAQLGMMSMGCPIPFDQLPEEIKDQIRAQGGGPDEGEEPPKFSMN
jgi:hypothetical protein